jgi:glycosyltransferase involved in cell wall biosynthesis
MIRENIGKNVKKLCIITDQFPPYPSDILVMRGGIDIGLEQLTEEFIKHGIPVIVITQNYVMPLPHPDASYIKRIRTYIPYSLEKNNLKNGLRYLLNECFNPVTFWKIKQILRKERPEAILIGGTHQLSTAPLLAAFSQGIQTYIRYDWICPTYPKPDVCTVAERIVQCGNCIEKQANVKLGRFAKIGLGLLTSLIFLIKIPLWNRAACILPVNKFYSDMYKSLGISKEKIKVIPTSRVIGKVPLITERFINLRKQSKFVLLYVGRLSPEKGITLLLDSFNKVLEKNNDVQLVIAGDGLLRLEVKEIADKSQKITYLGWQAKEQLSELYQISDAVVIPSIVP